MASRLTPCPSCTRHVKVGAAACPFCGGSVPTDVPQRVLLGGRPVTRAALLFAGATAVTACSSSTTPPATEDAGKHSSASSESSAASAVPLYGASAMPEDAGQGVAHYGGFVEPDGGVVALYGVFVDATAK